MNSNISFIAALILNQVHKYVKKNEKDLSYGDYVTYSYYILEVANEVN